MSITPVRRRLDRKQIVDTAVELADENGIDTVSMRNIAERLGVTAMALYKHVANRSELLDEMLDQALSDIESIHATEGWISTVRARIFASREVLASHPWVRDAIESGDHATPRTLAHMDSLMEAMFTGGLSPDLVHHAMHALSTRMWGFTRDVLPTPRVPNNPVERSAAMAEFSMLYPSIVRMATTSPHAGQACDEGAEFTFALDLILGSIQHLHERGWNRSTPARKIIGH